MLFNVNAIQQETPTFAVVKRQKLNLNI